MSIEDRLMSVAPEDRARERALIAAEFWENYPGRNTKGTAKFRLSHGSIELGRVEFSDENGVVCVHVWTGDNRSGSPQYRIINPPMLVEDPQGDVQVTYTDENGKEQVRRFKEDPVKAIVDGIVQSKSGRKR